ncbi:MAG: hypothetical protein Q8N88_06135, partial [Nanoarchaeota archaeon]|nr:hypothetical protein [Nanoarchaeota archaeon]
MKPTKEELERMYYDEKLSTTQIADKCEVHYSTILRWMRKSKMTARDYSTSRKLWCEKRMPSKEELERMYIQERMSTCEIAKLYDVCQDTIVNW